MLTKASSAERTDSSLNLPDSDRLIVPEHNQSRMGQNPTLKQSDEPSAKTLFVKRDPEYFRKARYIKIHAPGEREIDQKEFILLCSRNVAGQALRVDEICQEHLVSGWNDFAVEVKGPHEDIDEDNIHASSATQVIRPSGANTEAHRIFLRELGPGSSAPVDRYARLDCMYNISFLSGYKCQDLGILDNISLEKLRRQYIKYLSTDWNLADERGDNLSETPLLESKRRVASATAILPTASIQAPASGTDRKVDGN